MNEGISRGIVPKKCEKSVIFLNLVVGDFTLTLVILNTYYYYVISIKFLLLILQVECCGVKIGSIINVQSCMDKLIIVYSYSCTIFSIECMMVMSTLNQSVLAINFLLNIFCCLDNDL